MNRVLDVGYTLKLSGKEFIIKEIIGKGASSVTYLAEHGKTEHILKECNPLGIAMHRNETGELVADTDLCKQKFEECLVRFKDGANKQLLFRLTEDGKNSTSNIQDIHYANGTAYIDMTYFRGKTYDKVDSESLYDLFRRMKALAQIVGHYHKSEFLHLDIKPQNIYTIPETPEMVMMFDFDSVAPIKDIDAIISSSYTDVWAAPEQKMPKYRNQICEATDFFAIGEIVFYKLFGKHSEEKDRYSFSHYEYSVKNEWLKNVNPRVFPMITELLHKTLSCSAKKRYQNADQLVLQLDKIIDLSNPKEPFLKSSLPNVSGFFTGRDAEIEEIHKRLQENNVLFLSGIGGIGKSELAKHYADKYKDSYDAIVFAPFVNDVQMMLNDDNYVSIYNFSQYPEEKSDEYFARKIRKLSELCDKRTLIIVDNLDTMEDENLDKLFKIGCKMIVTTRIDLSDVYLDSQIDLGVLSNPFAVFEKYYTKSLSEEERNCVDEIIEIVCGHTMTVELLAKQMMAGRVKPEKMLEKLKDGGISESGKEKVRTAKDGNLAVQSTYNHIQALFDLSRLDEDDKYVLANLSLVPHTGIATELFCGWCEIDGFDAINRLAMEGWVRWDRDKDYISLHPILAETILKITTEGNFESFIKNYIDHLRERDVEQEILAHREDYNFNKHILSLIQRYKLSSQVFGRLACDIGGNFYLVHQLKDALKACEISVHLAQKHLEDVDNSDNKLSLAQSLSQKALVQCELGSESSDISIIRSSIEVYLKAIALFKEIPDDHPIGKFDEIATLYSYAGMAYEDLDELENAREMYHKGIEIYGRIKSLDKDDYQGIGCLYNHLGNTYTGNTALKYYLLAKENHEKVGVMTRHLAITLYHLADVYSSEYKNNEELNTAVAYAEEAMNFFLNEYSEDLYMIGEAKYMLGKVYSQFDDENYVRNAYTLLNEAEEIFNRLLLSEDKTLVKTQELIEKVCNRIE